MSALGMRERAAERAVAREYETLRPGVLRSVASKLAAQRLRLDPLDLDAVYNQAWHALYERLAAGEPIDSREGFLVTVAYRRAIEELRRARLDRYDADADVMALPADADLAERLDDVATLRRLMEGMRERLDARERRAAALCLVHGYTRAEAAEALGEPRKRMEKVMDAVTRKLVGVTGEIRADWCASRRSLVTAYALGLLEEGGERHRLAVAHLAECSACRRFVNTSRGLAGVLVPADLPVLALVGAGAGVAAGGAAAAGSGSGGGAEAGGAGAAAGTAGASAARRRRPTRTQAAVAAVLAMLLLVGGLAAGGVFDRSEPASQPAGGAPSAGGASGGGAGAGGGETSDGSYAAGETEASPTDDATYLRGAQATDANGIAQFTTIYPGWYAGRTVHIHLKAHIDRQTVLTTQLYFDEALNDAVFATAPYRDHTGRDTTNDTDAIYDDAGLLSVAEADDGYTAVINLGIDA